MGCASLDGVTETAVLSHCIQTVFPGNERINMPNRLREETSPYLRQHADDPVDWYPWGPEALAAARTLDRPLFLSIGYASCHWCHVMQRESFSDPDLAELLNASFINVKVDREERPDLDAVYVRAVAALTGAAGWPLSVWLTPEGVPFFGGTYFPPEPRFGRPSFRQVLVSLAHLWSTRRSDLLQAAEQLRRQLAVETPSQESPLPLGDVISHAADVLAQTFDSMNGGWGPAPKFPQPLVIDFLLALQTVTPRHDLARVVERTLDAMASGGLYDHLGGGFHRYCVDASWQVPHFEKMLYDNAQLARCYLHAWQATGKGLYRQVASETLDYLVRDMRDPLGGFYGSEDADSEGKEGAFYTWTPAQLREALDPAEARLAEELFGVTPEGHLEGASILTRADLRRAPSGLRVPEFADGTAAALKTKLFQARARRPRPARDQKLLAGWNGLALAAFAEAGSGLPSKEYLGHALNLGSLIRDHLLDPSGALAHSLTGGRRSGEGFLDDYACVAEGLLSLYQATFDEEWFLLARQLCDSMAARFRTPSEGFFDTGPGHERLITRPRALSDSPTPAGLSAAATVLLKLAAYTGMDEYSRLAAEALRPMTTTAADVPVLAGQWLSAALMAHQGLTEVAVVGDLDSDLGRRLLEETTRQFRPLVVRAARPSARPTAIDLLSGREAGPDSSVMAWVCRGTTCAPATSDPGILASLLADSPRSDSPRSDDQHPDYQREPPEREPPL
jgi:uncharacterized protein YyaL (SSP411 family)